MSKFSGEVIQCSVQSPSNTVPWNHMHKDLYGKNKAPVQGKDLGLTDQTELIEKQAML